MHTFSLNTQSKWLASDGGYVLMEHVCAGKEQAWRKRQSGSLWSHNIQFSKPNPKPSQAGRHTKQDASLPFVGDCAINDDLLATELPHEASSKRNEHNRE